VNFEKFLFQACGYPWMVVGLQWGDYSPKKGRDGYYAAMAAIISLTPIMFSYEHRGIPEKEAERRAWATVNKDDAGGKKSGSGRGAHTGHPAAHKGGRAGGAASASRSAANRSASAKKAAATRKRNTAREAHL
jgi:hypothetical protein